MRHFSTLILLVLFVQYSYAQKKPLTHDVYDLWESVDNSTISNNGLYISYEVNPQEGDGRAVIESVDKKVKVTIPRGYGVLFPASGDYAIVKIKAPYAATRDARIKKVPAARMPKDSFAIVQLSTGKVEKYTDVKSSVVTKESSWILYAQDIVVPEVALDSAARLKKVIDSLNHLSDSLKKLATQVETSKNLSLLRRSGGPAPAGGGAPAGAGAPPVVPTGGGGGGRGGFGFGGGGSLSGGSGASSAEAFNLVCLNAATGKSFVIEKVNAYAIEDGGKALVYKTNKAQQTPAYIIWKDLKTMKNDTILSDFNDVKSLTGFNKGGTSLVFLVEQKAAPRGKPKTYEIFEYVAGQPKAKIRVAANQAGIKPGLLISENTNPTYSKDGQKIIFAVTEPAREKDTTLVEFETAVLDIWHWKDEQLQPQQLLRSGAAGRRGYTTYHYAGANEVLQIADEELEGVQTASFNDNALYGLATSSKRDYLTSQYLGYSLSDVYLVNLKTGARELIIEQQRGPFSLSPSGNFVYWFDREQGKYFTYEISTKKTTDISSAINDQIINELYDNPDTKPSYGISGWYENDEFIVINGEFDLWKVDPKGIAAPVNLTDGYGKKNQTELRIIRFDMEEQLSNKDKELYLRTFSKASKNAGVALKTFGKKGQISVLFDGPVSALSVRKAKDANKFLLNYGSNKETPHVYVTSDFKNITRYSEANPQQEEYIWHTAELVKWTMFDGKESEGILYKPENFDSTKQYPVIFYFYEKNSDRLHNYNRPAPSASTINIAMFTSNGYLVFDPNIYYKTGQPGEDAYNSIVSAAEMLAKRPYVNGKKMGIQGQSWGGYQVAYLVTRTNMFAAAGAGAPVANMTSAYGGIRWGSGVVRQFQYERGQSRIGRDLWTAFDDYIKNSPLFFANKVETPLLIMHNDKDGAVPWYQGIEYFTALRRFNKPVWLLQYNNEDHNLVQRKNRKDLSIRLSQFFDHFLKDAPAPVWLTDGVPAKDKGYDWGLEIREAK